MILTHGYPKFDENDTDDCERMRPAFEQILSSIRQHGLSYNETSAVFTAIKHTLHDVMTIPKNS
mgnify:CR=1 FL=1